MVIIREVANPYGDTYVTYYGPVNTYTMMVASDFDESSGEDVWPSERQLNACAEYLIGVIAPQDNDAAHTYDTVINLI